MAQFNQLQTSASQVVNPPADFIAFHFDDRKKLRYFDESGPLVISASMLAFSSSVAENALQLAPGDKVISGSLTVSSSFTVVGTSIVSGTLEVTKSISSPQVSASFFSGSKASITEVSASDISILTASINNLTVIGTASIKYLDVQYETASHIFLTGSTRFGDEAGVDTHSFTGSVGITGSFSVNADSPSMLGNTTVSGSINITGSTSLSGSSLITGSLIIRGNQQITGSFGVSGSVLATGLIGIVSGSGSFSGSGANLYDISASAIVGLNLSRIATGSVTASVNILNGTGSIHLSHNTTITGSLRVQSASAGENIIGTASWAVDAMFGAPAVAVSASYPRTQRNVNTGSASGSLWWNTEDGNLYIQAAGPSGSTWVPAVASVPNGTFGATYTHTAATAATTWSVNHNLNTSTPIVQVYTGSQVMVPSSIRSVDANNLEILFATATAGTAIASTGVGGPTSASYALTAVSSSFATTASFITGSNVRGTVSSSFTASYLNGSDATYVMANKTYALNIPTSTATIISGWDAPYVAVNAGEWSNSGVFRATKPGTYLVSANIVYAAATWPTANASAEVWIVKGGYGIWSQAKTYIQSASYSGLVSSLCVTAIVPLAIDDTFYLQAWHNNGSTVQINGGSNYITIQELPLKITRK